MYHDAHDVFGEKDRAINIFFLCVYRLGQLNVERMTRDQLPCH